MSAARDSRRTPAAPNVAGTSAPDSFVSVDRSAIVLVVLALAAAIAWSLAVPIFESPDEPWHWQYARYLHQQWRLPVYSPRIAEANSPPLYYVLIAPLARRSDTPPAAIWAVPDGTSGLALPPRLFLNSAHDLEYYWPIRLARLVSALLTALVSWYVYRAAAEASRSHGAGILAGACVAFLPQLTFRGPTITNDALLTPCAAACTFHLMRFVRGRNDVRNAIAVGLWLAAAYLAKINAIALAPGVLVAALVGSGTLRARVRWASVALTVALVLVLPWSIRNVVLYGDPFASGAMHTAVSSIYRPKPLSSAYFWTTFPHALSRSFVGVFGWMNFYMPEPIYALYLAIALAGAAGLAVALRREREQRRVALVLGVIALATLAVVVHINRSFDQPQGRFLFPALPALGVLWGLGVRELAGHVRFVRPSVWMVALSLAGLNGYVLTRIYLPGYYPPAVVTISERRAPLEPAFVSGLRASRDGWFEVTSGGPLLAFTGAFLARDFAFLQFDIEGTGSGPLAVGRIFFATGGGPGDVTRSNAFTWRPDRTRQRIIVPLLTNPQWRGMVSEIRVDPFEGPVPEIGRQVRVSGVVLRGSLDRESVSEVH